MQTLSQSDIDTLKSFFGPALRQQQANAALTTASNTTAQAPSQDIVSFAEQYYYIPETQQPIILMPHQKTILRMAFDPALNYQTIVYSTVKKSGKTAIAGLVARWAAETWGRFNEIYCVANDLEQARGRVYQAALESIELDPRYNGGRRELPGKWRVIERQSTCQLNGSIMRAVSSDYKGEAGSNPTVTLWSELWGYSSEASRRLWEEMTPVPTRPRSIRYVETYAGFTDESDLLLSLYNQAVTQGRRLTHQDMLPYGGWPFPDQPPIYVNDAARIFAYWDEGEVARRMPWQTPEYYASQSILRPEAFSRLHLNLWSSSVSNFIPIEWWHACYNKELIPIRPGDTTSIVLGVDASVSNDCTGIVGVSRAPNETNKVALRLKRLWVPTQGNVMDLREVDEAIREYCKNYNVVQVAYDAYQLHKLMSDLTRDSVAWCKPFSQAGDRNKADKQLYDIIRDRLIYHDGDTDIAEHIKNCAAKIAKDEDTKLRLVKKAPAMKIDLAVALSMACYECLRLML